MKAVCSECIDIDLPVSRVFDFVSDLTRWPVWLTFVVCAQNREGAEVELCLQRGKRRWRETFDVIRFVPNAFLWLEGDLSAARRIEFRFEQRRIGTRLHCAIGYPVYGGGLGTLCDALFERRKVARDLERSLLGLKSALEDVNRTDEGEEGIVIRSANEPLPA
jgi:hypothetical protein